jgi:glycosyltransferase involved in cell wall biosynthesis
MRSWFERDNRPRSLLLGGRRFCMKPPLVLQVITRLNVGGPARQTLFLHRALPERGFATELVSGSEEPREGRLGEGVPHNRILALKRKLHPVDDLVAGRALHELIKRQNPDVVHTHMAKAGALGRLAAWRAGVPVVVHTFHGHVLSGYFPRPVQSAFIAVERYLARRTDALIAVSPEVRDQLLALGVGKPWQWRVIPVGVELDGFLSDGLDAVEARRQLGLPLVGPIVGTVGRLVAIKDHETFFWAAARMLGVRPDLTFVVAGGGEHRDQLEERAVAILGDRIRFLGWVSDLPRLYAALDVVVLTSRNEGTPTTLIEAGAARKPVVATRVGGVPSVVRNGETGFLVPPGRAETVARRTLDLLNDPDAARALGTAARKWVREWFSAERLADDLDVLYRELLTCRGITIPHR